MIPSEGKPEIINFGTPASNAGTPTNHNININSQMTFLQSNSPTAPRDLVTDLNGSRVEIPSVSSPSLGNRISSNGSPSPSVNEQINVAALSIDHSMTETTQLTSPQNASTLTTRGRAPVRDGSVESIPAPIRCINPASGALRKISTTFYIILLSLLVSISIMFLTSLYPCFFLSASQ
jgi:hypothetical protein